MRTAALIFSHANALLAILNSRFPCDENAFSKQMNASGIVSVSRAKPKSIFFLRNSVSNGLLLNAKERHMRLRLVALTIIFLAINEFERSVY